MPCIRHLLLMSISNRFEMPISQTADALSTTLPSSSAYVVSSMGLQLVLKDSCAEVVSGDLCKVQLAVEEIEKEIWDSLFVHGFKFQSQPPASGKHDGLSAAVAEHAFNGVEGNR